MLQNLLKSLSSSPAGNKEPQDEVEKDAGGARGITGVIQNIGGGVFSGIQVAGEYYFPPELVGGVAPRVSGQEREIAWNAAAEACDSERIHMVWTATEDRVWYVASRAADLAAYPHTWCPFASLLPGMPGTQEPPVCYVFYSDEAATMMTVTKDLIQIHRGTSSMVRAKVERVARELGGAKIVELTPEQISKLTPQTWYSASLYEDRVRRLLSAMVTLTGVMVVSIAFLVWLFTSMVLLTTQSEMSEAQQRSVQKSQDLLALVQKMRTSDLRDQLTKFTDLNDGLVQAGGWLKLYEAKGNKVRWKAIVPSNLTGDRIRDLGGKTIETTDQGVLIGNDAALAATKDQK